MLNLKPNVVRYTHSVDIFDLPEELQEFVREYANKHSESMRDYSDGDFYFPVSFKDLIPDSTPETDVQRFIDEEADDTEYPYAEWRQYCDDFYDYLRMLRYEHAIRYIRDNLPPEVVAADKIAIWVWH